MPLDEHERKAFLLAAIRAMAEYTLPFLSSVIGVIDSGQGRHLGSALRCILSGKHCLVTARHVIHAATEDYPHFAFTAGYGTQPFVFHGANHVEPDGDLALLLLPDDYLPNEDGAAFWPEERIESSSDRLATDLLFAHGFPGQHSYPSALLGGIVNRSLPYGAMQKLDDLPGDLAVYQFALPFDTQYLEVEAGESDRVPDPRGLSGAPVWRIGASGRSIAEWTPEQSVLTGMLTQWRPQSRILAATKTERLLRLSDSTDFRRGPIATRSPD